MNCKEIEEELTALVDNETPFFRKLFLKTHLWRCRHCHKLFNVEASVKRLVRAKAASYSASQKLKKKISERLNTSNSE